jgi:hypothetical protein
MKTKSQRRTEALVRRERDLVKWSNGPTEPWTARKINAATKDIENLKKKLGMGD